MNWFLRVKKKWNIDSNIQFVIIMIVFAITGSFSVYVSKPILCVLNINQESLGLLYYPVRVLIIFPIYQISILVIGTLFGQFIFFWNLEKKILIRLGLGFFFNTKK